MSGRAPAAGVYDSDKLHWTKVQWIVSRLRSRIETMMKVLSEMTRADWLTRRWINTTPPGSPEMMFAEDGDFPQEQRTALLDVLHARPAAKSDELVA